MQSTKEDVRISDIPPSDKQHPICKDCHQSHLGYYSITAWENGYCPECGPTASDILKNTRELKEFHGVPTGRTPGKTVVESASQSINR